MGIYYTKPPLGVTPKEIHREARIQDLQRAIREHLAYGLQIPLEWAEEYNCLLKESEDEINED